MEKTYYDALLHKTKYGRDTTDQHLLTFFSLAVGMRVKNILELGVRDGNSTLPWILAAKENGGMVTSVDLEQTRWQCPSGLKVYWKFIQSDAIDFLENCVAKKLTYDIIYVDDWHAYAHVKRELELIENLVTPNSLVLIHDLMYDNSQPHYHSELDTIDTQWAEGGPYRAVAELDLAKWEWSTIPVNHGMTLLRRKSTEMRTS
jgi:predicted O-methyltransferase YrrM